MTQSKEMLEGDDISNRAILLKELNSLRNMSLSGTFLLQQSVDSVC